MPPIGNGVRLISNPGITRGAILATTVRSGFGRSSHLLGFYSGDATVVAGASIANTAAYPNGYEPPYAWQMAPKGGGLASYNTIDSENTLAGAMAMGINIAADMTSDGGIISPNLTLLIQILATLVSDGALTVDPDFPSNFVATMTSEGALTVTSLTLLIQIAATLVSDGNIAAAAAAAAQLTAVMTAPGDLTGNLGLTAALATTMVCAHTLYPGLVMVAELAAALASNGQLTASLGVLAWLTSVLTSAGGVDGSALRGTLAMSSEMTTEGSVVTAAGCAAAVWNAIATQFNTAGTMGAKVNAAASAGDPWGTAIPGGYVAGTAGAVLGNLLADIAALPPQGLTTAQETMLVELFELMGLDPTKPLVVTPTSRDAGAGIEQTVATVGTTTTVTRTP